MAIKKESDKFTASSCKTVAAVRRQFKLMRHAQEASSGTRWGPDDAKRRAVAVEGDLAVVEVEGAELLLLGGGPYRFLLI